MTQRRMALFARGASLSSHAVLLHADRVIE